MPEDVMEPEEPEKDKPDTPGHGGEPPGQTGDHPLGGPPGQEDKPDKQRGFYMHPELYNEPAEKGMSQLIFNQEKKEPPSPSKIKPGDRIRK